jgi:16S rRNA processing protein RimM
MTTGVVVLGEISGVFGVKGWLKIRSYTRPEDQILAYREILVGNVNEWLSFKVSEVSGSNKALRISLASILSRDGAEQLVGKKLAVERKSLKNVQKGEYYWLDLIGLKVFNLNGEDLGVISTLYETGANDVLEVRGDKISLIPYVSDVYIKSVDLTNRKMIVDWDKEGI